MTKKGHRKLGVGYLEKSNTTQAMCKMPITKSDRTIFSHPDYTVGFGISPNPAPKELAGLRTSSSNTAGREFHPAPKMNHYLIYTYYRRILKICKVINSR